MPRSKIDPIQLSLFRAILLDASATMSRAHHLESKPFRIVAEDVLLGLEKHISELTDAAEDWPYYKRKVATRKYARGWARRQRTKKNGK